MDRIIWRAELSGLPPWRSAPVMALRMAAAIGRDLARGQLTLWAMSLVYTTLLSLVPLLAISFPSSRVSASITRLSPCC